MAYGIKLKDRRGRVHTLPDTYTCPRDANSRITRIIDAQLEISATAVYHRAGNSIAKFTCWKTDYVEAWRVTL